MTTACASTEKSRRADHGEAEESESDVLDEWREGRIGDESPVEMARVGQELQLVAMKAVAVVGEQMEERDGGGDGEEDWRYRSSAVRLC